ncbi:hypothetical protein MTO96_008504 [Rhipicephalus appendiculatus]
MSLYLIRAQETRETRGARPSPDRTRTFLLPSLPVRINPIARTLAPSLSGAVEAAYLRAVPASRPVNGCRCRELVNLSVSAAGNLFAALRSPWPCMRVYTRTARQLGGGPATCSHCPPRSRAQR